jgi:hypothetical protein
VNWDPEQEQDSSVVNEVDDRLAGDLVWELFPDRGAPLAPKSVLVRFGGWTAVACLVAAWWVVAPPVGVFMACLAVAWGDFRRGWQVARSIPDKAGGTVCARFAYAWAAWKLGLTAVLFMFGTAFLAAGWKKPEPPPAFFTAALLVVVGYSLSAMLTALGLVRAYRSGMRVWVGEGVNRARTLLLAMLIVGFTVAVLGPLGMLLTSFVPNRNAGGAESDFSVSLVVGGILALAIVGPVVMLVILDWLSRRVVALGPSKFGAKVPTVGKFQ